MFKVQLGHSMGMGLISMLIEAFYNPSQYKSPSAWTNTRLVLGVNVLKSGAALHSAIFGPKSAQKQRRRYVDPWFGL